MFAIYKRELKAYFQTPIGFIFMGLFLLITGIFFSAWNIMPGNSFFSNFLGSLLFIFLFGVPILTMRLFSEERKQKTDQLLLTSPISIPAIVTGKFLAAFTVYGFTIIITFLYALLIAFFGDLMWGETIGSYIGFLFLGAGYISIGVLISAGTENQLTAALVTFFSLLIVLFIEPITMLVPSDPFAGIISAGLLAALIILFIFLNTKNKPITLIVIIISAIVIAGLWILNKEIYEGFIRKFLGWFSLNKRYQPFTMGIIKIDALVYYSSFCALFLFLTVRIIEKRRWN